MQQAVYQPTNIGHFGLALEQYAHFTSPIRRYPDLVVHRTLRALLAPRPARSCATMADALALWATDLSQLEKRADEADRYVDAFLKCVYLRDRIGQTFEGLITTVVEFGCFVQLIGASASTGCCTSKRCVTMSTLHGGGGRAWVGARQQAAARARRARARHRHRRESHRRPDRPELDTPCRASRPSRRSRQQAKPHGRSPAKATRGPSRANKGKRARAAASVASQSDRPVGRPDDAERLWLHAVRAVLERGAERVVAVYVAEQRDDPRARAVLELASQQTTTVKRVPRERS